MCILLVSCAGLSAQDGGKPVYQLPENQNEIVFVFDQRNGFTPPRETDKPVFSLRADGTIEMPKLYGPGRHHRETYTRRTAGVSTFCDIRLSVLKFDANTVQGQIEEIRKKSVCRKLRMLPTAFLNCTCRKELGRSAGSHWDARGIQGSHGIATLVFFAGWRNEIDE